MLLLNDPAPVVAVPGEVLNRATLVVFGGSLATEVVVLDDATLTCEVAPQTPGTVVGVSLANANGSVLLAAFVVGAAQVFGALTPSRGIFTLVANFFFLTALLLMLTARPDGPRFLRSLALLFGAALLGRHVLLAQLAPAGDNLSGRLFARALEGVTLGALGLERLGSATGYVALAAAATLWIALWLAQSSDA